MSEAIDYCPFTNSVLLENGQKIAMIDWIAYWEWQHKHYNNLILAQNFISEHGHPTK